MSLGDPNLLRKKTRVLGQHVINGGKAGVVRRYVSAEAAEQIFAAFPTPVANACLGLSYSNITALKPHVHTREECVINWYIDVGKHETVFYEGDIRRLDGEVSDNGNGYFLVDEGLLKATERFCAATGDVWLLNSKRPHAVLGGSECNRWVMQAFFGAPFGQMKQYLIESNLVA
jgi:hypothetical protein